MNAEKLEFEDVWMTTKQAAKYLNISIGYLRKRRLIGGGPDYHELSERVIRYSKQDLDAFASRNRRRSTSDQDE